MLESTVLCINTIFLCELMMEFISKGVEHILHELSIRFRSYFMYNWRQMISPPVCLNLKFSWFA